jgi:hypothetical protein
MLVWGIKLFFFPKIETRIVAVPVPYLERSKMGYSSYWYGTGMLSVVFCG